MAKNIKKGPYTDSFVHLEGYKGVSQMLKFTIFTKWTKSNVYNLRTLLIGLRYPFWHLNMSVMEREIYNHF